MQSGDPVEVNHVWASNGGFLAPSRTWGRGFEFVELQGTYCVVRHTTGLYQGMEALHPVDCVRAVRPVHLSAELEVARA